ncbi:MAG: tRNA uridine-5-carboxymethylaminomethyl(34) synthesis GTPase MnmE [Desulfosarcina sp.]|nr:tRNA uridine-5-carboxymethylaminomethyl(34) synthesis GTPase MnmE [Desulfosarcina sp.]
MIYKTIAAISTPLGPGGIGIIRISGPGAYAILKRLFVRKRHSSKRANSDIFAGHFSSHLVYYGYVIESDTRNIIDEVLAIYMKGPKSFTREDVVEIHSHSGFVVLDRILSAVVDAGANLSGPGEFTKRAFLNGRIDITQAEAIIDLINAPCETAAQMASCQVAGGVREAVNNIIGTVTALQAKCEAFIEFSEAGENERDLFDVQGAVRKSVLPKLSSLIQRQKETAIFREGILLAIAGAPNVGKSSLLNKLVERETAIVSEFPGTTRDVVREYISINGVPVVVCDTAGIHDTKDPVECIGIAKARDQINRSDIVLVVLEATRSINRFEEKLIAETLNKKTTVVINKDDIADDCAISEIEKRLKTIRHIRVSAKLGTGIAELKDLIFKELVSGQNIVNGESVTPNLRQRKILEKAKQEIQRFNFAVETEQSLEFMSGMLNNVLQILEEISGNRNKEDLYNHIFDQFCIGK